MDANGSSIVSIHYDHPTISAMTSNQPEQPRLPIDMTFNDGHILSITTYSVLLVASVCGNVTVLVNLLRRTHISNPRVSIMLVHLAIADLLVALLLMPIEIGWAATVQWRAGDSSCRILAFFRTFGLFLSSFVLVCISIDRFGAILQPLQLNNWKRRGRFMLGIAWASSVVCSLPQVFIFHVESHPEYPWYEQCVTFNSFPTRAHEIVYAAFGMTMMYVLPLVVFIFTYGSILCEISQRSKEISEEDGIRRMTGGTLSRARIKTVKMTLVIISAFIFCWTPYNIMSIWFWCDRDSALQVDQRIQKGLFLFACANSCVNPVVYGIFSRRRVRRSHHEFQRKAPYHPSRAMHHYQRNNNRLLRRHHPPIPNRETLRSTRLLEETMLSLQPNNHTLPNHVLIHQQPLDGTASSESPQQFMQQELIETGVMAAAVSLPPGWPARINNSTRRSSLDIMTHVF